MYSRLRKFVLLTRFEQTLFGLPFILVGASLPFFGSALIHKPISYICMIPAFIAARVSGMSFNQYFDRHFDALNPRTCNRLLPKGLMVPQNALYIACGSLALFLLLTICISNFCFLISCFSAGLIVLYSFMKRIHYSCHLVLGMIHFLAPITAFIGIKGTIEWPILWLSLGTFFLHTGNDILYAQQDYVFDCEHKLHSIPSQFGIKKSLNIALALQVCCVLSLILFGIASDFFWIYYISPCIAAVSFYFYHKKRAKEPGFFFIANTIVSVTTLIFTFLAGLWHALL